MCLPIGCWLCCMSRTVDDDPAPASRTTRNGASHYNGNGGHHYSNGNGYLAHGKAAAAEADRKASNDVRRGPAAHHAGAVAAARGWPHGHAPANGAQEKIAVAAYPYPYAGADEMLKQQQQQQPPAAWNGRVAAADGHGARGGAPHNYYERAQLPAHREDAVDYHYTASTATADHERY